MKGAAYWDTKSMLEGYQTRFREYGIDMEMLDPAEAATRIRASDIQEQLIVALDYWAGQLPAQDYATAARLLDAVRGADDNAERIELRARGRKATWIMCRSGWSNGT